MSKTAKKVVGIIFCMTFLVTMFNGTFKASSSAKAAKAAEDVTLTLLIDNNTNMDGFNAVIAAFEKKTGIKTEVELRPGGGEGDNIVKTRLATGEMADLCAYNSGSLFKALNPSENFVDLSKESFAGKLDNSFKVTVSDKGKLYGIPTGSALGGGWMYNKKVYAQLGLKVPKTWKELYANCDKIKKAGKTAVLASYKTTWTSQLILLADFYNVNAQMPKFADLFTANKAKYASSPITLKAWERQQEIFKKGYMNKDFLTTTYEEALKRLANGQGAMYPMITFCLPNIAASYPTKINDIGFFPQPSDNAKINGITVWEPGGIYIYKNSKNIDAAKKWFEFFVSDEGLAVMSSKVKAQGPYVIKGAKVPNDAYAAVKDMLPYFNSGKTAPALEFLSPLKGPNCEQITVQNGSGIKTPKENAAQYDKDCEKQAKQLGLAGW